MANVFVEKRVGQTRTTYRVRFEEPGTKRLRHHGTYRRKADADKAAGILRGEIERGAWFDPRAGRETTVRQWVDTWSPHLGRRVQATADRDRLLLDTYWLPVLGDVPLAALTPGHVIEALQAIRVGPEDAQRVAAAKTLRTAFEVLHRCLTAAVDRELIPKNPCDGARRALPKDQAHREIRFLSVDELHTLAGHVREDWRVVVWLCGVVGLRWSEAAGLRVGRVDFLRRTVTVAETLTETVDHQLIEGTAPKSKSSRRTVQVPQFVLDELAAHLARTGRTDPAALVVQGPKGGPAKRAWFRQRVFGPAVKAASLDGLTVHGLRHSAAGLMIAAGAHPKVIQERLGHADIRTTLNLYGHVTPEVEAAVTAALQGLLTRGSAAATPSALPAESIGGSGG